MPLIRKIPIGENGSLSLWKVTERQFSVHLGEKSAKRLAGMKREDHRLAFLAVRMLLQDAGLIDPDLLYEPTGRPYLANGLSVSISHSNKWAALYLGPEPYGIDIEQVSPRILQYSLQFIGDDVIPAETDPAFAATLIWTVKEAIYKLSDSRPLHFAQDLHVTSFDPLSGTGTARSTFPGWVEVFIFCSETVEDHVLTRARKAD